MKRIAVLSIIIEKADDENVLAVNNILHQFAEFSLGRMGIPDKEHGLNIISVVLCADQDTLNNLSGKLGNIKNVTAKLLFSNNEF